MVGYSIGGLREDKHPLATAALSLLE